MSKTVTGVSESEDENAEILKNNRDYTLLHWVKQKDANPINVSHADGSYFWDRDNKRYIDFSSQLMNVNIGHGNKKVAEAVAKQMAEVSHTHAGCMVTKIKGLLGKKISEIAPDGLNKSFFTLSGSDANEAAIMLARFYTGRHKIIARYRSYHGTSNGAASISGDPRKQPFDNNLLSGIVHVEDPYSYRCPWGQTSEEGTCEKALEHVERIINFEGAQTIAAIFMEGESGTSGCIKYPEGYLKGIRVLADKYDILMISDEVMSGFGRCGNWFGVQNADVIPDMITMAKGLTSGYIPMGGVIVHDKIADYLEDNAFGYGMTYGAHPVACAAALASIEVIEEEGMIENTRKMGEYAKDQLLKMMDINPSIGDVRITGLLGVIEVVKNRETKEPMAPWNASADEMAVMNKVFAKLRELGLFTFTRWNFIFVAPPLNVTKEEMDEGLAIISEALKIADEHCC